MALKSYYEKIVLPHWRHTAREGKLMDNILAKIEGRWIWKVPYGYNVTEQDELVPKEEEAKVIKEIFKLAFMGYSASEICKELERQNIPSPEGKQWRPSTVIRILKSPVYAGRQPINHIKEMNIPHWLFALPIKCQPIVSWKEFILVQSRLKVRGKTHEGEGDGAMKPRKAFVCSRCGKSMFVKRVRGKYYYLSCRNGCVVVKLEDALEMLKNAEYDVQSLMVALGDRIAEKLDTAIKAIAESWRLTEEEIKVLRKRFHDGLRETRKIIGEFLEKLQKEVLAEQFDTYSDLPVKFVVDKSLIKVSIDL